MSSAIVNFVGIGGQKCASTWLYDILEDHPQACLSSEKELDFFSNYWDRGYEWYESKFHCKSSDRKVVGEVSPSYLCTKEAPVRLKKYNANTKIIVILRNPVERAYSNHKHNVRQGFVLSDNLTFEAAIKNNSTYVEHGFYGENLSCWLTAFPRDQILVLLFDDILNNAQAVAQNVYQFLDISTDHVSSSLYKKSNESVAVSNVPLALFVDKLRQFSRKNGLIGGWDFLRRIGIRYVYRLFNQQNVDVAIPKMRSETRQELFEIFRKDIESLESLLNINLDSWKTNKGATR